MNSIATIKALPLAAGKPVTIEAVASVALADDPTTARHGATVMFIDGVPGDYDNSGQELRGKVRPSSKVYDELGLEFGESMRLSPEDIARLAEGS